MYKVNDKPRQNQNETRIITIKKNIRRENEHATTKYRYILNQKDQKENKACVNVSSFLPLLVLPKLKHLCVLCCWS